ncbi:MAG: hypothetical protein PHX54_14045 [Lentimicrobiaceae bacterium]|nr:hypothetical protein [Lentimicrobiaceae bacterium]
MVLSASLKHRSGNHRHSRPVLSTTLLSTAFPVLSAAFPVVSAPVLERSRKQRSRKHREA